jgi:hypothetical protein
MWINANRPLTVYLLFCGERASGEKVDHLHAKHLRGRAEEFRRVAQNITEEHTRNGISGVGAFSMMPWPTGKKRSQWLI